jgi:glycosyltransferase involved in cell wall biosynthesis
MVLLVHPGTQYSYQLAKQLARHQKLAEFWTGFALAENAWYTRAIQTFLPNSWNRKIANRIIRDVPISRLRTKPLIGLKAVNQIRRGHSPQVVFHKINGEFQRKIPSSVIEDASAVIGFDTSSWLIAERAKNLNKPFFLDQSISHPVANESVLRAVVQRFPKWREDFESRLPVVLYAENQEHALATKIVAASSYTKRTLISEGVKEDKIIVNPYGVSVQKFQPADEKSIHRPLRFIFVGSVSARKGVPLLLEAWRSLDLTNCELWLVGPLTPHVRSLIPELPGLKVLGKYPHKELPNLFRQADVFVFPSYCEGFGLVLLEALASGLPIVTTEATAGPDLIQDGVEGFIVPSGNQDELCRAMKYFVDNPGKLPEMSVAARRCAEKFTWDAYGDRWNRLLEEYI